MPKRKPAAEVVKQAHAKDDALAVARSDAKAASWRRKYRDAARENEVLLGQVELLAGINQVPARQKIRRPKSTGAKTVAVIAPASDWHVEEVVYSEAVNGKNEYNLEIAEDRIKRYYGKLIELIDHQSSAKRVSELWHPLLGDFISGHIHPELEESNEVSPTEAVNFVQEMICSGIDHLLKETKLPIFLPTCVGNHGRTTQKTRIKTRTRNSFEWLLYMTMQSYYRNEPRVQWMVGNGYHNIQTIMGRGCRFHHGDGMRYNGGVGGITIPVNKSIAAWDQMNAVDFDFFGHYHQFIWGYPKWVSNGCLIGYSEFALEIKAGFQHPSQTFAVLDREYGLTTAMPIFVTEPNCKRNTDG